PCGLRKARALRTREVFVALRRFSRTVVLAAAALLFALAALPGVGGCNLITGVNDFQVKGGGHGGGGQGGAASGAGASGPSVSAGSGSPTTSTAASTGASAGASTSASSGGPAC